MTGSLPIDDPSRVAAARRLATSIARAEGLDEASIASVELVTTEMATNLLKHAQGGEIHVTQIAGQGAPGVDVLSIDRGPGITSMEECLRDGHSGTGTSGTGLGAIARLSRTFDAYSETGKGTVMVARLSAPVLNSFEPEPPMVIGFAGRPVSGEDLSGDSWAMRQDGAISLFIIADGLGHGIQAAEASAEAISAFRTSRDLDPTPVVQRVHRALRGTRGAAVAVASVDRNKRVVRYAGIGNISGVVVSPEKTQFMISHNGTAGHEATHFQEFIYPFPKTSILIMHSDGLSTSWNLAAYPGLKSRHPSVIAGTLYRDAARNRDDACIVVAKDGA